MSDSATVAITTVLFIRVTVDIVGNTLVCAIVKRNRPMRTPINYLLANLAVADIMYATFIVPRVILKLMAFNHPDGVTGTLLCKLLTDGNIAWIGSGSSFVTLVAIAIERYYEVMYPLGDKWDLTQRKLKVIISGSWVFGIILNIPLFLVVDAEKKSASNFCVSPWPEGWMGLAYSWTLFVVQVLPLALMIGLYSRVVYALWFKDNDDSQLTHQQKDVLKVRKRVTLMVVTISAIFGICLGGNAVEYILRQFPYFNISPAVISIVDTMVLFNSAVNPFVYALLNQQFREKMKVMMCCRGPSASRVHPMPEPQNIELAGNSTHPTHTAEPCCTE